MYRQCVYIIMLCTDGITIGVCLCVLMAANGMVLLVDCGVHLCRYYIITDIFVSMSSVLLYHYILLPIILQDVDCV